jgi:crotonobetainyl-CoA:carnitine CoA-transferase CaiB-like acyl-CoA transferase
MNRSEFERGVRLAGLDVPDSHLKIIGADPVYYSPFHLGEGAAIAHALIGSKVDQIWREQEHKAQQITVDVRHAAASLNSTHWLQIKNKSVTDASTRQSLNPMSRIFRCKDDRFIHLHKSFRDGPSIAVELGIEAEADVSTIAQAVSRRDSFELEAALIRRGLTGAVVRNSSEWVKHPQGKALLNRPVVEIIKIGDAPPEPIKIGSRPLSDLRVLDLTRVLAGPTSARTLAEHGADVVHVASPNLPTIDLFEMDTGHGKRQIHIDLDTKEDADILTSMAKQSDVFSQGFRKGALDRRGFGSQQLATLRPGIIYVSENCYGHHGPWANRPGWEQFAQTVSGVAKLQGQMSPLSPDNERSIAAGTDPHAPRLTGAAMNDYVTASFATYGVLEALQRRAKEGGSWHVQVSLTQTSMWFARLGLLQDVSHEQNIGVVDDFLETHDTPYGEMAHLAPVLQMSDTQPYWAFGTRPLGSDVAEWI